MSFFALLFRMLAFPFRDSNQIKKLGVGFLLMISGLAVPFIPAWILAGQCLSNHAPYPDRKRRAFFTGVGRRGEIMGRGNPLQPAHPAVPFRQRSCDARPCITIRLSF